MNKVATTEQVVKEMLSENTGRHVLDSGGAYGRNWERNQGRDFASEPEAVIDWEDDDGPIVTVNLYHFLVNNLGEYRGDLTQDLYTFSRSREMEGESWTECLAKWCELKGIDQANIVGENSYNGESVLSQVIQWWECDIEDDEGYETRTVILQIHRGCDVRGGYTAPRIFETYDEYCLAHHADATVYCNVCGSSWYTDDSWHWYANGEYGSIGRDSYNVIYPIVNESELTKEHKEQMKAVRLAQGLKGQPNLFDPGETILGFTVRIDYTKAICPICGIGELKGGM